MNTSYGFAVPDAIEPVTGWRAWALARAPDGRPELRPIIYAGERWPAGAVALAECPPHASSGHHAPEADCSCGLYAVDELDRLPAVTGRDVTVIGSVSMWGTLIEHDSGLRAELAYPDRLRLICGECWHAGAFSPDVVGVSETSRGTLLALCERHARGSIWSEALERELLSAYAVDPLPEDGERGGGRVDPSDPARPSIAGADVSRLGRDVRPVLRRVPGVDGARVDRAVNRDPRELDPLDAPDLHAGTERGGRDVPRLQQRLHPAAMASVGLQ